MLEARIKGQQPVVSKHAAETLEKAAKGAASKLKHVLETIVGKISDRRRSVAPDREQTRESGHLLRRVG